MCKTFTPEDYPRHTRPSHRRTSRHSEVRYSVISDEDHNTVTFVVIGACTRLVHDIISWMWAKGAGLIRKADVKTHIPLHFLNGKHRREIWVEMVPDLHKCGLPDLCLLFEAQFHTRTDCTVKQVKYDELVNI